MSSDRNSTFVYDLDHRSALATKKNILTSLENFQFAYESVSGD